MGGQKATGTVTGTVFTDTDKAVEGLFLRIAHSRFGPDGLKVATLNEDGMLDVSRRVAFLFIDPAQKLLSPATFTCRSDRSYRRIYQHIASLLAILAVSLGIIFFAKRKADTLGFGQR